MDDFGPQLVFVTRLRHFRQRAGISLDEVAAETRVKREFLEAFERKDLSSWPRGLYARAWVRAYASAVGLDPIDTVKEFCRLFPHVDWQAQAAIGAIASIVEVPSKPSRPPRWPARTAMGLMAGVTKLLRARAAGPRPSRTALR